MKGHNSCGATEEGVVKAVIMGGSVGVTMVVTMEVPAEIITSEVGPVPLSWEGD